MKRVHVAVGVIRNAHGDVLISLRAPDVHMGGLWEFPGGKVEAEESPLNALRRELHEELGIDARRAEPLIRIHHDYHDKRVLLDVWDVSQWVGEPTGREGQPFEWVQTNELHRRSFPDANQPIIQAVVLPKTYPIIDSRLGNAERLITHTEHCLATGHRLLQLRAKTWPMADLERLVDLVLPLTQAAGASLLLNSDLSVAKRLGVDGVHLSGSALMAMGKVNREPGFLMGVSCHNPTELRQAQQVGAHFAVLSPVAATATHPKASPLGWETFHRWVENANLPVYALGGMKLSDQEQARRCGAQGLAGIGLFQSSKNP